MLAASRTTFDRLLTGIPWRLTLLSHCGAFLVLGIIWCIVRMTDIGGSDLLRDPAVLTRTPWYMGAVSYLGVLSWWAAAAICLFVVSFLSGAGTRRHDRYFMLCLGGLSALLALDDLYMFHETSLGRTPLGDLMTPLVYGTLILSFLLMFRELLLDNGGVLLLLALGFLGTSMLVDLVLDMKIVWINDETIRLLLEDGSKFVGIVSWLSFSAFVSHRVIARHIGQAARSDAERSGEPQTAESLASRII